MTGKEALINLSKTCKELELEYGNFKINKTDNEALQTLKEIVQKYDKYKRAFEILKDLVIFDKENQAVANGTNIIDLSKEEAELLEELMKGE